MGPWNVTEKFENDIWSDLDGPPTVGKDMFSEYASIFHGGFHYYFGGQSFYEVLNSIIGLEESSWSWSIVGHLTSKRRRHEAILVGERFMIIGGFKTFKHEACLLNDGIFSCTELSSNLTGYANWPVLFPVEENYKNC